MDYLLSTRLLGGLEAGQAEWELISEVVASTVESSFGQEGELG